MQLEAQKSHSSRIIGQKLFAGIIGIWLITIPGKTLLGFFRNNPFTHCNFDQSFWEWIGVSVYFGLWVLTFQLTRKPCSSGKLYLFAVSVFMFSVAIYTFIIEPTLMRPCVY